MKNTAPYLTATLVLAIGLSANVLKAQEKQADIAKNNAVANAQEQEPKPAPMPRPSHDHVIYLQPDGTLVGTVNQIDPHSLHYVPAPDVDIAFIQNRRIIAKVRTNADGRFTVKGLSSRAVYSVISRTSGAYSAVSFVVMAAEEAENTAATPSGVPVHNVARTTVVNLMQVGAGLNMSSVPGADIGAFSFGGAGAGLGPGLGAAALAPAAAAGAGGAGAGGAGAAGGAGGGLGAAAGAAALGTAFTVLASPSS